jgi:hypothetical protein
LDIYVYVCVEREMQFFKKRNGDLCVEREREREAKKKWRIEYIYILREREREDKKFKKNGDLGIYIYI